MWFEVCGWWFEVCGLWFMVSGLWFVVYGLRFVVYGLWFVVCFMRVLHLCLVCIDGAKELERREGKHFDPGDL